MRSQVLVAVIICFTSLLCLPICSQLIEADQELIAADLLTAAEYGEEYYKEHHKYIMGQMLNFQPYQSLGKRTCNICKRTVKTLQVLAKKNQKLAILVAKDVCIALHLQAADVCRGIIDRYGTVALTVLSTRYLDPLSLCSSLRACSSSSLPPNPCKPEAGAVSRSSEAEDHGRRPSAHETAREAHAQAHIALFSQKPVEQQEQQEQQQQLQGGPLVEPGAEVGHSDEKAELSAHEQGASFASNTVDAVASAATKLLIGSRDSVQVLRSRRSLRSFLPATVPAKRRRFSPVRRSQELPSLPAEQQGEGIGHFLHLTDVHLDLEYTEGADTKCGRPLCCRLEDGPAPSPERRAHTFGEYTCDTSPLVLEAALNFSSRPGWVDFVVYTGDTPPHTIWSDTEASTTAVLETVYGKLRVAFGATPVYPVLGNHGTVPADELPPPPASAGFLYGEIWKLWSAWLPAECELTVARGLYYTLLHEPGLRIVGLNTQWCDTMNFWLLTSIDPDPAGQLAWLSSTLQAARDSKEGVIILGHIPPGDATCYISYSQRYVSIVSQYADVVLAQLFGHTHVNEFKLQQPDDQAEPTGVQLIAPSLTPFGGGNPTVRRFSYLKPSQTSPQSSLAEPDLAAAALLDYCQYIFPLQDANEGRSVQWTKTYCARDEYQLADLSPSSWAGLVGELKSNATLRNSYLRHLKSERPFLCDANCQSLKLCYLQSSTLKEYVACSSGLDTSTNLKLALFLNSLRPCRYDGRVQNAFPDY